MLGAATGVTLMPHRRHWFVASACWGLPPVGAASRDGGRDGDATGCWLPCLWCWCSQRSRSGSAQTFGARKESVEELNSTVIRWLNKYADEEAPGVCEAMESTAELFMTAGGAQIEQLEDEDGLTEDENRRLEEASNITIKTTI
eukprot:1182454-Prorocentrum_minimum.AAC.2